MTAAKQGTKPGSIVVEMRGIVKQFPGVLANDNVDFRLYEGEIHALLGENGAGKSTLMNVLAGLYRCDSGSIYVNNTLVDFKSPKDAINAGVGMVHQHFMLVPSQTVTENILLGLAEPRFRMKLSQYDQVIANLGEQFGMKVDPSSHIWQLSVGEQQRVEILKMLYRGAQVLILDEPTAVLAPQEIEAFFSTLRAMVSEGKSIIFISHKLGEVTAVADRVTVLRRGKVTAPGFDIGTTTRQDLARLMVGRDVAFKLDKESKKAGEVVLSVHDIHAENDKGLPALRGVSLNVKAGEIVGIAGVAGNGQRELAQVISGLRQSTEGEVFLKGVEFSSLSIRNRIRKGLGYIPEDRTHVGTAPNLSVTDNVIMKKFRRPPIAQGWKVDMKNARTFAEELKGIYDIMVPTVDTPVRLLSGGNLQRVILAREISGEPTFLLAMQPTRGLDVGAIEGVQRLLLAQREAGSAILLVSEELDELMALSDRIYVMYEGKIMGEVKDGNIDLIGQMMTGSRSEQVEITE